MGEQRRGLLDVRQDPYLQELHAHQELLLLAQVSALPPLLPPARRPAPRPLSPTVRHDTGIDEFPLYLLRGSALHQVLETCNR